MLIVLLFYCFIVLLFYCFIVLHPKVIVPFKNVIPCIAIY